MRKLVVLVAVVMCVAAVRARAGEFKKIGPQITASTLIGTTFAKDADGVDVVCTVMRGQPAKLVVIELRTGEIRKVLPLVGADGGWNAATASDGSVYVGSDANGHLYRWVPGEGEAKDLGSVGKGQAFAWDVCAGKDGEVFVSTWNGCRVVRYHPDDGFKEVSRGPASAGEEYARSVAYHSKSGKVYVGVGSHAHLVELDPKTGEKVEMLPKEYAQEAWVYGVSVFGDFLFAYVADLGKSLVIDLKTREVVNVLPAMSGQQVMTQSPVDQKVYYVVNGRLWSYDMARPMQGPEGLAASPNALGMTWVENRGEPTLVVFSARNMFWFGTRSGHGEFKKFKVPTAPVAIQSITPGPDGRIWMGGYLSGGNAAYDPETGKSEEYKGLSQSESIAVLGDELYFGIYPGGRFAVQDATQAWAPKALGKIQGQSRPFAGLGVKELNQVFFGMIPEYGLLGGGIAVVDAKTKEVNFHHNVTKDHSVTALAYADGLVVGGTSVWGGLGIKPTEREGKLFLWDPRTNEKVFETVPVEGISAVTSLISGPDGKVWGMAAGTLFVFDVAKREVVSRHRLFEDVRYPADKHVWRDAFLVVHPSGDVYGTVDGSFFRLDPATKRVEILRHQEAGLLAMDRRGRLYFRSGVDLWQYVP